MIEWGADCTAAEASCVDVVTGPSQVFRCGYLTKRKCLRVVPYLLAAGAVKPEEPRRRGAGAAAAGVRQRHPGIPAYHGGYLPGLLHLVGHRGLWHAALWRPHCAAGMVISPTVISPNAILFGHLTKQCSSMASGLNSLWMHITNQFVLFVVIMTIPGGRVEDGDRRHVVHGVHPVGQPAEPARHGTAVQLDPDIEPGEYGYRVRCVRIWGHNGTDRVTFIRI